MNIDITIMMPAIWGSDYFKKDKWGFINVIVGPNGTGKSLFSEQLRQGLSSRGIPARLLNAERLSGFDKGSNNVFGYSNIQQGFNVRSFADYKSQAYNAGLSIDAFVRLKERLDVRIKIEAVLSDIFRKVIRLVEEGGFLVPKVQNIEGGGQYNLRESECHGLKELITLLTFLYDPETKCLIFDEPELHLHPQYQSFFMNEIRKVAGDPLEDSSKKLFFIITHSPYFLDFKTIDDLKNVLVCHYNAKPTYIDELTPDDEFRLKKFLPRLNTHHKQFFFSPNPVFVEGFTDQQIITLLYERLGRNVGASGSCVIDVGGKDDLEVFFRLCKKLKLDGRYIIDLDGLFAGKLRQTVACEQRCEGFIQQCGIGSDVMREIGDIESILLNISNSLRSFSTTDEGILELIQVINSLSATEELHKVRVATFLGIHRLRDKLISEMPEQASQCGLVLGRMKKILEAFSLCNVYVLENGEIEHYYTQNTISYMVTNKDKLFEQERDYLLTCSIDEITQGYGDLLQILNNAVPSISIDLMKHLKFVIVEWIQKVQLGVVRGEIKSTETLAENSRTEYNIFSQIINIIDFQLTSELKFSCTIQITNSLVPSSPRIIFTERTVAEEITFA